MSRLRLLVVVAHYGHKNRPYLLGMLEEFRQMPFDVTIEVLSESPKDLGPDVHVRVGVPGRSPWTLPFAYKQVLAERQHLHDVFVYTEDDIGLTTEHVRAFLRASEALPDDCVPGFVRYEVDGLGNRYFVDLFRAFHFDPESVRTIGGKKYAELTNLHAACFMLTRGQLAVALSHPTFLRRPCRGLYDFAETAATEPYTQGGLRKLIPLDDFGQFCLHHLTNKYFQLPSHSLADARVVEKQIQALRTVKPGLRQTWFRTSAAIESHFWDMAYYSPADGDVAAQLGLRAKTVLSIGCGAGSTEALLARSGKAVTAIPLDRIVSASLAEQGVDVRTPDYESELAQLEGQRFDAILLIDILPYVTDPVRLLRQCRVLLADDGAIIVRGVNFSHISLVRRVLSGYVRLTDAARLFLFRASGVHATTRSRIGRWLEQAGLSVSNEAPPRSASASPLVLREKVLARLPATIRDRNFLVVARISTLPTHSASTAP